MEAPEYTQMTQKAKKTEQLENPSEEERLAFLLMENTDLKETFCSLSVRLLEL
jgi:hypothetical protein